MGRDNPAGASESRPKLSFADNRAALQPTFGLGSLEKRAWWRDSLRRRVLAAADAIAAVCGSVSVLVSSSGGVAAAWAAIFVPASMLLAKLHGLYDLDHRALRHLTVDELPRLLMWATSGVAFAAVFVSFTPAGGIGLSAAVWAWLVAWTTSFALRAAGRMLWRRVTPPERTLIVGSGPLADATRRKVQLFPDMHLRLASHEPGTPAEGLRGDSALDDVDRVILAAQAVDEALIADLLAICRSRRIKLSVVPPIRGMFATTTRLDHVADLAVVQYNTWDVSRSTLLLKRSLDIGLASAVLLALSPLLLLIALSIRLDSRGPVIFAQTRAGLDGRPFRMYKFRTMVWNAEELLDALVPFDALSEPMFKLRDDPRVTRVGRLLRKTSVDELPQLLNVFKGEMSLVGPRPEQVELVDRYAAEARFRLRVKPGLTGPMQVYGRGELSFEERLAVDRDYIENLSLGRDLRILALTVRAVAKGEGAF